MEITATGGLLLLVIAILWLGFMAPSGKSGLANATQRRKRVDRVTAPAQPSNSIKVQTRTQQKPWYLADVEGIDQKVETETVKPEKIEVNRLPDPLSARLGKIENVQWAEVRELNEAREEKENLTSQSLDEILQRRRSNG